MKYDYLKQSVFWQKWFKPAPDLETMTQQKKWIGRFFIVNFIIKEVGHSQIQAWTCPVVISLDKTEEERDVIRDKEFPEVWKKYLKELEKKKFIAIAPAPSIPDEYKDVISFYTPV